MFEKSKIQGSINYLLRCHQMGSVQPCSAEKALAPLVPKYAKIMRERNISADQTAVLLISETLSRLHIGNVTVMNIEQPELVREMAALFVSVEHLSKSQPDKFGTNFVEPEFLVAQYLRSKVQST